MSKPKLYLAGPISGATMEDMRSWRERVAEEIDPRIEVFSPLRSKGHETLDLSHPLCTDRAITTRDLWDVKRADLILVCFEGAAKVSIGTVMEIAYAHAFRVPVLRVLEPGLKTLHSHPMLDSCTDFWASSIEEAIEMAEMILLP